MVGLLLRILRLMVLAVLPSLAAATGYAAAQARLEIERSDPNLTSMLAIDRPLYVAVRYRSDVPVRLRAEPYYRNEKVEDGLMSNPTVLYPPGSGAGLAWLAFWKQARVDRVDIVAYDEQWNRVGVRSFEASLRWTEDVLGRPATPSWVGKLRQYEAELAARYVPATGGALWDRLASALTLFTFAALPLYLVLQPLAFSRLAGNWRKAAMAPLLFTGPAAGYAAFALAAGSNLWPIVLILVAPFAVVYLAGLFAAQHYVSSH
ncbi:MAG: hypothetical protein F9K19_11590 [Rhizobiaceae bacterium]|nr:MAG: hypothetical protein F9K19_11590 [Rhizobiaceae bacterium]CAG1000339.1 hypothetical protein RHIZO_02784 [Rhizobiaceae bacterium]